ncbi:MAG: hypothetical protein ACTHKR_12975 [Sphingomonas sp.]
MTAAHLMPEDAMLGWLARDATGQLVAGVAADQPMRDAIDARLAALRDWSARHPGVSRQPLIEAAAVAPLVGIEGEWRFDERSFADLVDFAAELPW